MMDLTEEEAEAYYLASLREFELGAIGDHGFRDRMRSLADMLPYQLAARFGKTSAWMKAIPLTASNARTLKVRL